MKGENQTKEILIERTSKTLELAKQGNKIFITGPTVPDNAREFFEKVVQNIEIAIKDLPEVIFEIQIEYFNPSSSKCLLDLFKMLEKKQNKIKIIWIFEEDNEDVLEAGEYYQSVIMLPFELTLISND